MTIAQALTVAFQFVGQPMPDVAIAEMAQDLTSYQESDVLAALKRCRSELKSIKFSDILDRIPGGHPGPEEAWATIAAAVRDESKSLVWSDEMREAYGVANNVGDDPVQARMVFKELYIKAVSEARAQQRKPNWSVSKGTDKADQERVIRDGVTNGRLTVDYAKRLLPYPDDPHLATLLVEQIAPRLLS
jgi:hypothetical protein